MTATLDGEVTDLQRANAELQRRLNEALADRDEALQRENATSEILRVINSSAGDAQPTLDAIAASATSLCGAASGAVFRFDGSLSHLAAHYNCSLAELDALRATYPLAPTRGSVTGRAILTRAVAYVADIATDPEYALPSVVRSGMHAHLSVPMLLDGNPVGAITVARREVTPFSEAQIELLKTFAVQAVIAMENSRLLTETREALEQQTATAEVLQVINSSPGDLSPVFDAILEKAHTLCGAALGGLVIFYGKEFRPVAVHAEPSFAEYWRQHPVRPPSEDSAPFRLLIRGERLVHFSDVHASEAYRDIPIYRDLMDRRRIRTLLIVPLRKGGALLGAISAFRQEVRPFTEKQIALLENFAAQAVIAMENARLLTETREALEQQTATAEVLQVINSSPGDLAPVFDAILGESAYLMRCRPRPAEFGLAPTTLLCNLGRRARRRPGTGLRRGSNEGEVLGAISLGRNRMQQFTERQIELVGTFADQAVIAMENARLLGELQARTRDLEESLEYQTATSEVLNVISRSTADVQPVLDTVAETAVRLCGADGAGITIREGEVYRYVSATEAAAADAEFWAKLRQRTIVPGRDSVAARVLLEGRVVHIEDIRADPDYALPEAVKAGLRTILGVPLLREGAVLGTINVVRYRVQPFTDRQIELVRTFADQAVIAMENARLLTELRESLEQQTATAEVLQVINSSPGELQPVFEAILEKAHTRCGATRGTLFLFDGETFRGVAVHGVAQERAEQLRRGISVRETSLWAPLLAGARISHIADLRLIDDPVARAAAERGGVRTILYLALRKDGGLLGVITCYRDEVRPFLEKEIALLENFAAQAVIAMDNARLLGEIRQRQAELRVTFDNMGDGVAMFDAEQRLAAWNRNFQQLLDLPDTLLAERPSLADYIRHLATRGEYGEVDVEAEVRRLIEAAGTQYSTERTRPDGHVIEVRANPVPGGGVVINYSDITGRKRSEEEIRAARDAAEAALADLHRAQDRLIQSEKMASLGQLTAGIAHERSKTRSILSTTSPSCRASCCLS